MLRKIWYRKLDRQVAIQTAKRMGKKFFRYRMEETWVICQKDETTLFKHVTPRDILDHLGATSTGRETIDVIGAQQGMLSWWVEDLRVPKFINRCEEEQRKVTRSRLAI